MTGPFPHAIIEASTLESLGMTNNAKTMANTANPIHPRL